jgi:hypothetical protein
MNSGQAMQRAMAAGALLFAGGLLLFMAKVTKVTKAVFEGEAPDAPTEQVAPAPPKAAATAPGVIHVQEGDPLPPATPLPRPGASPPASTGERSPAEMTREELIREVASLRGQVARMEAQQAAVRAALHEQGR